MQSTGFSRRLSVTDSEPTTFRQTSGRLLGLLAGGRGRDPADATKHGLFFNALGRHYQLIDIRDVSLRGLDYLWNGLMNFHPNKRKWKERYYKNLFAFVNRSLNAAEVRKTMRGQVDLTLQVGVLFDACWSESQIPNVIYTDYTAKLSAENPYRLRSPFRGGDLAKWLDYETRAYRRASHIFTRSELVRQNIIGQYGIAPEHVSAVGGGVNFETFPELPNRNSGRPPTVLFIGSHFKRKGGDILLHAFEAVRLHIPPARLRLLTRDPIPAGFSFENVEILPFVWDRARIRQLYAEADIFVLPSRQETWGDVILEAAAYSLPSISFASDAMAEVIRDGETGLLARPQSAQALATAIVTLLEDDELRLQLGRAARRHVQSTYTWDKVAERMEPTLDSLLFKKE